MAIERGLHSPAFDVASTRLQAAHEVKSTHVHPLVTLIGTSTSTHAEQIQRPFSRPVL